MRQVKRSVLSILLCLCMVLTLLPVPALAAWVEELTPEIPPAADVDGPQLADGSESVAVPDDLPATLAAQEPTDGVSEDEWEQVNGDTAICRKVDGEVELYAAQTNNNGSNIAVFENTTASTALYGSAETNKFLEITFREQRSGQRFGVYMNYTDPSHNFFVGYDSGGWFWQMYADGVDNYYGKNNETRVPAPQSNLAHTLRLEWNGTNLTKATVTPSGGETQNLFGDLSVQPLDFSQANNVGRKIGFKCTGYGNEDTNRTNVFIQEMHYTGQRQVNVYNVAGTVRDNAGSPVAGAAVTVGGRTATTGDNGSYTVQRVPEGQQTIQVTKAGYSQGTLSVNVNADLTGQNVTLTKYPVISGRITVKGSSPVQGVAGATVTFYNGETAVATVAADETGSYTVPVPAGTYRVEVTAAGYATVEKANCAVSADATLNFETTESLDDYHILETEGMTVLLSKTFPQVVEYRMKGALEGKKMAGQKTPLTTVNINGTAVTPTVVSEKKSNTRVDYTLTVTAGEVNAVINAHFAVGLEDVNKEGSAYAANTLGFYIDDVTYPNNDLYAHPVKSIEIPNHSLLSVDSTQAGAGFSGGKSNNNSVMTHDKHYLAATDTATGNEDFFAGFVYNNGLSAGLSSNSELGGGIAASYNYPIRLTKSRSEAGVETYALASTLWYYNYTLIDSHPSEDDSHDYDAMVAEDPENAVFIPEEYERPWAKVVICGDANENGKVDWQDGAIALRETVMHIPNNSDLVKEAVNTRISMNFGSQAQNPFLIALDNVKRVALHTDGLGQAVLLKGYANEGHDSGHPDYYDIGRRLGGAEDMNTLIAEGKKLGAYFGIHTNASELYAEAKAISDAVVRRNTDHSLHYGWNWLDQGIAFSALYDYGTGNRRARWQKLYDAVGANTEDKPGLEFIYVDVWGNGTSGTEDSWQTRRLSNEITSFGWRMTHEWSYANPYEASFHHWTTDFSYGDYTYKGCLNSPVLRFLLNSYKDAFPPDFATYGGACNGPLLGGPAMQGFEGWQGDAEYDLSIYNTYNQMVATKFLQHYNITEWIDAQNAVDIPYGQTYTSPRNLTAQWTPEMQITLKSDDGAHTVVVTRGLDEDVDAQASFSLENEVEYRSRVITLDGVKILEGAPASAGEDFVFPASKATLKYLIPWYWDNTGKTVAAADEKLYHWNAQGGESTWTLPKGWQNLSTVVVYKLTDQGRVDGTNVSVSGGKVTLNAEANTGYVVVKGRENKGPQFDWSTNLHVKDASFNVELAGNSPWTISGKGIAVRTTSLTGISVLKMAGQAAVSQTMNGLEPNTKYLAYVAVDNRSDAKATMEIKQGDAVLGSNYTGKSIAQNYISAYYLHTGKGVETTDSYFQNMYVFFETGDDVSNITLTLSREPGSGATYWDDIRVLETEAENFGATAEGRSLFTQDFEHVAQGQYPFVVGPVEGVADNRQHLSELNPNGFTQAGWDVKKMDDVIEGNWSIKVNGLVGRNNLVMQTIPQNFHFEPGVTYTVEFDYEMGSAGTYWAAVGDGAYRDINSLTKVVELEQTLDQNAQFTTDSGRSAKAAVGHASFTVTGGESGQTWVGIVSTSNPSTYPAGVTSGSAQNFGGYNDFILDNLVITEYSPDLAALKQLTERVDAMDEEYYDSANFAADWADLQAKRQEAETVLGAQSPTPEQIEGAATALQAAVDKLREVVVTISGTVTGVGGAPVEGAAVTLEDATYIPVSGYTATTDAQGAYSFRAMVTNPLPVADYQVKVQATGYNVVTVPVTGITKASPSKTMAAIELEVEAPGAYVNDFTTGDISMMGHLDPPEGTEVEEDQWPELELVEYNGSNALQITWHANSGETRHTNNVVDKTVSFTNGSISFDITPLDTGKRFGVTLRGGHTDERLCIGQQDSVGLWMGEFWNGSDTSYTATTQGKISVDAGVTRNVRVAVDDRHFQVFVDGDKVYDINLIAENLQNAYGEKSDNLPASGYAGVNVRNEAGTRYIIDNIRIVSADPAEDGTHTVSGTVADGSGIPLAGVAVQVLNGDGAVVTSTTTNAAGAYRTPAMEPGEYTLHVAADFYTEKNETVSVNADKEVDLTMTVEPGKLLTLYNEYKDLSNADETYSADSFAALTAALGTAQTALGASPLVAADLSAAYKALSAAVTGLEKLNGDLADRTALREAYNTAAILVKPNGVSESKWADFQSALQNARVMLGSLDATQAEVDSAASALNSAYRAVTGGGSQSGGRPTGPSGNGGGGGGNNVSTQIDQTGTIAYTVTTAEGTQGVTRVTLDGKMNATVTLSGKEQGVVKAPVSPLPVDGSTVVFQTKKGAPAAKVSIPLAGAKPGVVAVLVKEDGTEELLPKTIVDGSALLMTVEGNTTVRLEDRTPDFKDVTKNHWANDAVSFSASRDLFKGTGDNEFSPNLPMNRAMLVTVLYRMELEPEAAASTFADVAENSWYAPAVGWANETGIAKGTGTGFAPDAVLTRETMALMLYRYAKTLNADLATVSEKELTSFEDGGAVSPWAQEAMAWAVRTGIMNGKSDACLDPVGSATRAEVATMLMRLVKGLNQG